jgi:uncharacterized protein YndB with AHSA1/START domain
VGPVTVETVISAPREAVFDYVGDLANHVAFTDHFMSDYRLARARSDGAGAAARFRVENPGPKQWAEVAISVFERPRRIVEEGHSGRFGRNKFWTMWDFAQEGPSATRVELTYWSEPATRWDAFKEGLGARRWVKGQHKITLGRLRQVFENERDEPLARVTVAGLEPWKLPRFGDHPSRERLRAKG